MELSVALMLILLGGLNLFAVARQARSLGRRNGHTQPDGGEEAPHAHSAEHETAHIAVMRLDHRLGHFDAYRVVRPLVVGVVHGLAGSAAVALLVLGTIRDPAWAIGYLAVFGAGTIAGMLLITTAMALPFAYAARRFERLHRALGLASGLVSLAFGCFLVYELGFVHGLFTDHPQWTPS